MRPTMQAIMLTTSGINSMMNANQFCEHEIEQYLLLLRKGRLGTQEEEYQTLKVALSR